MDNRAAQSRCLRDRAWAIVNLTHDGSGILIWAVGEGIETEIIVLANGLSSPMSQSPLSRVLASPITITIKLKTLFLQFLVDMPGNLEKDDGPVDIA